MGRIYDELRTNGDRLHALFDSGAVRSYVSRIAVRRAGLKADRMAASFGVSLGGKQHRLTHRIAFDTRLQGHPMSLLAYVLGSLESDEDGRAIDMIVGSTAMEEYNIRLDLRGRRVDLSRFRREFVEYAGPRGR